MDNRYSDQDFLLCVLIIVYSPISNVRQDHGDGDAFQIIPINQYLHVNIYTTKASKEVNSCQPVVFKFAYKWVLSFFTLLMDCLPKMSINNQDCFAPRCHPTNNHKHCADPEKSVIWQSECWILKVLVGLTMKEKNLCLKLKCVSGWRIIPAIFMTIFPWGFLSIKRKIMTDGRAEEEVNGFPKSNESHPLGNLLETGHLLLL